MEKMVNDLFKWEGRKIEKKYIEPEQEKTIPNYIEMEPMTQKEYDRLQRIRHLEQENRRLSESVELLKYRERFLVTIVGILTVLFTLVCIWGGLK